MLAFGRSWAGKKRFGFRAGKGRKGQIKYLRGLIGLDGARGNDQLPRLNDQGNLEEAKVQTRDFVCASNRENESGKNVETQELRARNVGLEMETKAEDGSVDRVLELEKPGFGVSVFITAVPFYIWAEFECRGPVMDHARLGGGDGSASGSLPGRKSIQTRFLSFSRRTLALFENFVNLYFTFTSLSSSLRCLPIGHHHACQRPVV